MSQRFPVDGDNFEKAPRVDADAFFKNIWIRVDGAL